MTRREEQIGWLRALVSEFERVAYDPQAEDEDPSATYEMLLECRQLADELLAELQALDRLRECVVFDDHKPVPAFDIGGESGGA